MANELTPLKEMIAKLEAKLNDDSLKPFYVKFEFYLLQVNTSLKTLADASESPNGHFNHYLMYKQLESTINEIQKTVESDGHYPEIQTLSTSKEYIALNQAKEFFIAQQQRLYPYYLAQNVQLVFEKNKDANPKVPTPSGLCRILNYIAVTDYESTAKKDEMEKAIKQFANTKTPGVTLFSSDQLKPLKSELLTMLEIEEKTNMARLFPAKLKSNVAGR